MTKSGIIREGQELFSQEGDLVGKVCSGTFSPVLKKAIGMAYIDNKYAKVSINV